MTDTDRLTVAVFRPTDGRASDTAEFLRSLGADPVIDPMIAVEPTGHVPRTDADYLILTSPTGVDCLPTEDWSATGMTVCAIGERTATALQDAGITVDLVPDEYSSTGLVERLASRVAGNRIEIARSDHGSSTLPDGLNDAGAYVHETVLYRLVRPPDSGESTTMLAAGDLDAVLFSSPLTVQHFMAAAEDRDITAAVRDALNGPDVVVGAIGTPTTDAATDHGIDVDVVPDRAGLERLAAAVVEAAAPTHHR